MKVFQAITKVQRELAKDGIAKDRQTSQYKFRGIDDIYNAIATILADSGVCIMPRMLSRTQESITTKNGTVMYHVVVEAEFDFVAAEDASKHTVKTWGEAFDSGDKATNKAMTAAHKYALLQTFTIPTEGDNDADATTIGQWQGLVEEIGDKMRAAKTLDELAKLYADGVKECRNNRDALIVIAEIKDKLKKEIGEKNEKAQT